MALIQRLREAYESGCEKADLHFKILKDNRVIFDNSNRGVFIRYS